MDDQHQRCWLVFARQQEHVHFTNYEELFCKVDRGTPMTQRNLPIHMRSAKMQTKLAERLSKWEFISYWVVKCYRCFKSRHYDQPTLFTFLIVERLYQIIKTITMVGENGVHQGRIHGVELLLIDKSSKLSMFVSNHGYACILCSILNREVHRHSTVKIES